MAVLIPASCSPADRSALLWLVRWLAFGTLLLPGTLRSAPPGAAAKEYQLKAVFLFNFAQFAEWPAAAHPASGSPIIIGVLGDDPFGALLDETVRGESVGGHPLVARRYRRAEDIDACHILFISRSETARLDRIVARLKDRAILTVSDTEDAARRGAMICFFTENKRIRLQINLESARAAGLVLSSKLLRPAEIVTGKQEAP